MNADALIEGMRGYIEWFGKYKVMLILCYGLCGLLWEILDQRDRHCSTPPSSNHQIKECLLEE